MTSSALTGSDMTSAGPRPPLPPRLRRESRTVEVMVWMYCRDHHRTGTSTTNAETVGEAGAADARERTTGPAAGPAGLCPSCAVLLDYALARVADCRFGECKPACGRCPVHCFRPVMRKQVRAVMRYAGPRMLRRHPYLAARHLLDRRRPAPAGAAK